MRIAKSSLAVLAAAAGLAATLAVPASAAQARATAGMDCSKPDAIAKLNNYGATVNQAAVPDVDGFHQLAPGQTMMMAISGTLSEAVGGGKVAVALAQEGQEKPTTQDGDLSKVFTDANGQPVAFPAPAGDFTWYLAAKVSENASPGRYVQALEAQNEAGRQVMCFQMAFEVKGA